MVERYVIGIDEVGRGPLAGPLVVCAVATTLGSKRIQNVLRGIKDSKKLSPQQRNQWHARITNLDVSRPSKQRFFIAVSSVRAASIDKWGISYAARLAVARCLRNLEIRPLSKQKVLTSKILLDGSLYAPSSYPNQETIIKGDEKIPLIAAASIVAKERRDRTMRRWAKKFPQYQFHLHKGYGTLLHRSLIQKHGLSSVHRKTFCTKLMGENEK